MRSETKTINYYQFSELSKKAAQRAIEKLWDINVNYEWWDSIYDDAMNMGLKISGFDIYRNDITLILNWSGIDCAKKIIQDHGETCSTFIVAKKYIDEYKKIEAKRNDDNYDCDLEIADLEEDFKKEMEGEYLSILRSEYENLASKEAIIETIEANEYEFDIDGNMI